MRLKVRARVQGGRLKLDEPVDLPEDTVVNLVEVEDDIEDDLDEDEIQRLNDALDEGEAQYQRGEFVDAAVVLEELRRNASGR